MPRSPSLLASVLATATFTAQGALVTFNDVNVGIPDDSPGGVLDSRTVSGLSVGPITDVNVRLAIDSAPSGSSPVFNGDLYVALSFGTGYSVLLTRSGRSATSGEGSDGYSDAGFGTTGGGSPHFTLDDQAANDVHTYRLQTGVLAGSLTGTWQPSARQDGSVDPGNELTSTIRDTSAQLSAFNGLDPNGVWSLYLIDAAAGGEARLQSWALEITGTSVPEPHTWPLVGAVALTGFATLRKHLRQPGA